MTILHIFFDTPMMQTIFFLLIIALISEILWTIAGFWSSSIFLPLALLVLDFKTALLLVAIYHIFGNASRLYFFRPHINKRIVVLFWIPSIILTVVGALLMQYIDQEILKMILGIILIVFASYVLRKPKFKLPNNPITGVVGWWLSGFTAWLIGTWGVLRGAFVTAFALPKEQYIGTIALVALIVDATRIPLYFWQWFLDKQYYFLIPFLLLIALIGSYIGRKIVKSISEQIFRKIILIGIIILSLKFVYDGVVSLRF